MAQYLEIRELAAWGFDEPVARGLLAPEESQSAAYRAQRKLENRQPYRQASCISFEHSGHFTDELAARKQGVRNSGGFDGLTWELAVIDLRKLIAFQRRIGFTDEDYCEMAPGMGPQQLLDLALPTHSHTRRPYMEAAYYRGRWLFETGAIARFVC